jgi:hypothetical protein
MIERDEEIDSMQIEINSFKFSQNKDFPDCITGILNGIITSSGGKATDRFEKWSGVLSRYISSESERLHTIKELERILHGSANQNQFHLIIKILYQGDIVDGDCILSWYYGSNCEPLKAIVLNI